MMDIQEYHQQLHNALQKAANSVVAAGARKYMKDQSEFFGVSSPARREILRAFIQQYGLPSIDEIETFALLCWNSPQREMPYCCMEIMHRMKNKFTPGHLPLFETLIQTKGWWDTVDFIAPSLAGYVLKKNPSVVEETVARWQNHDNMWMRRSAILHQLKYKADTDVARLFATCTSLAHEQEFFIRKAIGWALREYSKVNPEAVKQFVGATPLSGLSRREALKRIA